jgi:sigma-54-interacting transcriptional regulator
MENPSNAVAYAGVATGANTVLQIREEWRLAREAHKDLQIAGMPTTNLLLVGSPGATRIVIEMLWLELREPIRTWRPGEPLELPAVGRASTLVLHDVHELTRDDQSRVIRWLDHTSGRIRVVSTTQVALWPRVKAGVFNDGLYYRLNTVCVDVTM